MLIDFSQGLRIEVIAGILIDNLTWQSEGLETTPNGTSIDYTMYHIYLESIEYFQSELEDNCSTVPAVVPVGSSQAVVMVQTPSTSSTQVLNLFRGLS
jgi:hypothetical protein